MGNDKRLESQEAPGGDTLDTPTTEPTDVPFDAPWDVSPSRRDVTHEVPWQQPSSSQPSSSDVRARVRAADARLEAADASRASARALVPPPPPKPRLAPLKSLRPKVLDRDADADGAEQGGVTSPGLSGFHAVPSAPARMGVPQPPQPTVKCTVVGLDAPPVRPGGYRLELGAVTLEPGADTDGLVFHLRAPLPQRACLFECASALARATRGTVFDAKGEVVEDWQIRRGGISELELRAMWLEAVARDKARAQARPAPRVAGAPAPAPAPAPASATAPSVTVLRTRR